MKRLFVGFTIIICSIIVPLGVYAGTGFSKKLLLSDLQSGSGADSLSPRVCAGLNKEIYVVWLDDDEDGTERIHFKKSIDGGISFEDKQTLEVVTGGNVNTSIPEIGIGKNGNIFIIYSICDNANNEFSLLLRKSEDNGVSFDKTTVYAKSIGLFESVNYGTDLRITDEGIYYVWSNHTTISIASSLDSGDSFEIIELENDTPQIVKMRIWPSLTVDSNNNRYVIWYEAHITEGVIQPLFNLYSAKLENGQQSFSESKMIAECDSFKGFLTQPSIVATSTDQVVVLWNKAASSFQDNLNNQPFYAMVSNDGEDTFSEPLEITFGEEVAVRNHRVSIDQNDALHFIYQLSSNGSLYYNKSADSCLSFDGKKKISLLATWVDMCLSKKEDEVYVVFHEEQQDGHKGVYFLRSVEAADEDPLNDASESGGGGCFVDSVFNQ